MFIRLAKYTFDLACIFSIESVYLCRDRRSPTQILISIENSISGCKFACKLRNEEKERKRRTAST